MSVLDLVVIDTAGHQLDRAAAGSYARMLAAGCPAGVTSAYRTVAEQEHLIALHEADPVKYAYAAPVAVSGHPKGTRLDLPTGPREWVRQNGVQHGWWWGENPNEPWHYAYLPALDQHAANAITDTIVKELITMANVSDLIALIRCGEQGKPSYGAVVAINKATGHAKPVTSAAFSTLGNAGLLHEVYLKDGAGNDLSEMDEGPFGALVDVLSD